MNNHLFNHTLRRNLVKAGSKAMAGKHKELEEHFTKREKQRESA